MALLGDHVDEMYNAWLEELDKKICFEGQTF